MSDAERFAGLFRDHYGAINAFCLRRLDDEDSDDVTAEVFITTWGRLADVDRVDALAWLYAVARHKVAHRWRANGRRGAAMERLRSQHTVADRHADDPAAHVVDVLALVEAASLLSPTDLELRRVQPLPRDQLQQLGIVLGCSTGAATVRVHRMRERLQRHLDRVQSVDLTGDSTDRRPSTGRPLECR